MAAAGALPTASLLGLALLASPSSRAAADGGVKQQGEPLGEEIVVTGTVLKLDVPLIETPQDVTALDRETLDCQNVQTVEEALRYVPSIQTELSGRVGSDDFLIRGFSQSAYEFKDWLRLDPNYLQQQEQFGLERIEVFKGPASVL